MKHSKSMQGLAFRSYLPNSGNAILEPNHRFLRNLCRIMVLPPQIAATEQQKIL